MSMEQAKNALLEWIDRDRDKLIDFLSRFVQAKSPTPPGDTRQAAAQVCDFLEAERLPHQVVQSHPEMPNIIGSFDGGGPGRHLVLNGHIDVFPIDENQAWKHGPWSGAVEDGKIWGRGVTDMKCGTTASIFTFAYLHRIRDRLKGRLTLTAVSEEETFGPNGARYLMEHHPEVHGDCCLSGEPGSPLTIRFGEKGPLVLRFTVRTRGAHGAYTHLSESANKIAARLIIELDRLTEIDVPAPGTIDPVLEKAAEAADKAQGKGASDIVQEVTVNIGTMRGGLLANMVPSECVLEADIRLPVGLEKARLMEEIGKIVASYPQVTIEEVRFNPPSWCDPEGEMAEIIRANAKTLTGIDPQPAISLGCTDTRLWRYRDIPAYIYGPYARGLASADEHVEIEEFLNVVRTHVLSAYDYLTRN